MLLHSTKIRIVFLTALVFASQSLADEKERPYGLTLRVPWTTSRVIGSPDPPLPYTVEKVLTDVQLKQPIHIAGEPGKDSLLVVEYGNSSRILRMDDDLSTKSAETVLEIEHWQVYSLAFHPDYESNGQLLVACNGPTNETEGEKKRDRVSRYTVSRDAQARADPAAEEVILEWESDGHNGCALVFGHDGMLYVTSGDGTGESDTWYSAQDMTNLLGGVMRIDVDHPNDGRPYSIPDDNPYLDIEGARGELWAIGLRNPWKMCVDKKTGHIWVGNNGQDLWETAHLIRKGDNCGWSVYEGNHPFYLQRQLAPVPVVPATIEHHHREFRSLTGGEVYYGDKLPDLNGVYVYGDYSTGKIWGARHDGTQLTWHEELADTTLAIAGFAVTRHGELLVIDWAKDLYRLVPAPPQEQPHEFPRRLSETGVFVSVEDHQVQPGVIAYSVNSPAWADGTRAERFVALPGESQVNGFNCPEGTVLVQTLTVEQPSGDDVKSRRVETRLLTRQQNEWLGYTYVWNEEQDAATLAASEGADIELEVASHPDTGKPGRQQWRIPSRAECMTCHSRAAEYVLGFRKLQLDRDHDYTGVRDNQLRSFQHIGLFNPPLPMPEKNEQADPANDDTVRQVKAKLRLVNPYDVEQELDARARAYLHTNCSVCHVTNGGGNARIELGISTGRDKMNLIAGYPQHDTFGIQNALLLTPGEPQRSILYQRIARRGHGQMPPLVSNVVDRQAAELFHAWISRMQPERKFVKDWQISELVQNSQQLGRGRSYEDGKQLFRTVGCIQCHRFDNEGGGAGPDLTGVANRRKPREILESIIDPSRKILPEYATTIIATSDGEILVGRVEREDERQVILRTVDSFAKPVRILKDDIEERSLSPNSSMPADIVNTLERHQILDLLAYVIADGKSDHKTFVDSR